METSVDVEKLMDDVFNKVESIRKQNGKAEYGADYARVNRGKTNGGEVYTPAWIVQDMCNMLPDAFDVDKTYLDPCCGTGNITIEVLRRRLIDGTKKYISTRDTNYILKAMQGLYAVDINNESAKQCRSRLVKLAKEYYKSLRDNGVITATEYFALVDITPVIFAVNIVYGNTMEAGMTNELFIDWSTLRKGA